MKQVLLLGAGLSSASLIRYLLKYAEQDNYHLTIIDQNKANIEKKTNQHICSTAIEGNALDKSFRFTYIEKADVVISMLPAIFHIEVAKDCLTYKKHLITPSYVSNEMAELNDEAKSKNLLFLNEMGVDPGIDHMSAMKIMDEIREEGGNIIGFKSYCGGLIAPESDNNPWGYKFTWNPRNVVLAGQGKAAMYIEQNQYKYIPYHQLFNRKDTILVEDMEFEAYANRDSLSYRKTYGLENIPTIFRGTLRKKGFCSAWNVFVQLGMCDDSYAFEFQGNLSKRSFLNAFLPYHPTKTVEEKTTTFIKNDAQLYAQLAFLDFFTEDLLTIKENASPAQILQVILEEKLSLDKNDKDMLVMYHHFVYELNGIQKEKTSYMVNIGEDQTYTSMSNTVGLPIAIACRLFLNGKFNNTGVQVPVLPNFYEPILKELEEYGINFVESN